MTTNLHSDTRRDAALLAIRLMLGWVFVFHGAQKLFGIFGGHGIEGTAGYFESIGIPFPVLNVYLAGGTEFLGGLALLLGVAVPLAVIPMSITMLVASITAHKGFSILDGGMEYSLTLAVMLGALGLLGAGRWTFPALLKVGMQRTERVPAAR